MDKLQIYSDGRQHYNEEDMTKRPVVIPGVNSASSAIPLDLVSLGKSMGQIGGLTVNSRGSSAPKGIDSILTKSIQSPVKSTGNRKTRRNRNEIESELSEVTSRYNEVSKKANSHISWRAAPFLEEADIYNQRKKELEKELEESLANPTFTDKVNDSLPKDETWVDTMIQKQAQDKAGKMKEMQAMNPPILNSLGAFITNTADGFAFNAMENPLFNRDKQHLADNQAVMGAVQEESPVSSTAGQIAGNALRQFVIAGGSPNSFAGMKPFSSIKNPFIRNVAANQTIDTLLSTPVTVMRSVGEGKDAGGVLMDVAIDQGLGLAGNVLFSGADAFASWKNAKASEAATGSSSAVDLDKAFEEGFESVLGGGKKKAGEEAGTQLDDVFAGSMKEQGMEELSEDPFSSMNDVDILAPQR